MNYEYVRNSARMWYSYLIHLEFSALINFLRTAKFLLGGAVRCLKVDTTNYTKFFFGSLATVYTVLPKTKSFAT